MEDALQVLENISFNMSISTDTLDLKCHTFLMIKSPQNSQQKGCLCDYSLSYNSWWYGSLPCCYLPVCLVGCDDRADPPSRLTMPLSGDEPICPKFQPNIFDPSRCHDCLRQRHLHASAGESTEAAPRQKSTAEPGNGTKTGTDTGIGQGKGVFLSPIPSQTEERDSGSKVRKKRGGADEWR